MSLTFQFSDVVTLTQQADIDAKNISVPTEDYDVAIVVAANFLSGNYKQLSTNQSDIQTNFAIDTDALNTASFTFVQNVGALAGADRSAYGNAAASTMRLRVTKDTYAQKSVAADESTDVTYADLNIPHHPHLIPIFEQSLTSLPETSESIPKNKTSLSQALVNAVSQAMFKQYGRNEALNNDVAMKAGLMTNLYAAINTELKAESADYDNSKFFQRYLDSGRFRDDAGTIDQLKDFNLDDTVMINMTLKITGEVHDQSDASKITDEATLVNIFGDSASAETQVDKSSGSYTTHVHLTLLHDKRL